MVFDIIEHLQIRPELKESILEFRKQYPVEPQFQSRIPVPSNIYYGTDIWEKAVTALLCGKNILLVGHKATGKNIFAENLAAAFARPRWDVSFHVNMDAASLIGMDTFKKQEVTFRPGPISVRRSMVDLRCSTRLIWQKVKLWRYFMERWTSEEASMCRDMSGSTCTRPPVSSPR